MGLILQAMASRVLVLLALLMTFGLFGWAMWEGTRLSLINAGLFAVIVLIPVLLRYSHVPKSRSSSRVHPVEPEHEQ